MVYASRTAVLGLLALVLVGTRQTRPLAWLRTLATLLPVFDAIQTTAAGAPATTVVRHLAIAGLLAVTSVLLWRESATEPPPTR